MTDPAERLRATVLYELRHEDSCDYPIDGRCVCGPGQHLIDLIAAEYQRGRDDERERQQKQWLTPTATGVRIPLDDDAQADR